jgi:hypothetical protein
LARRFDLEFDLHRVSGEAVARHLYSGRDRINTKQDQ